MTRTVEMCSKIELDGQDDFLEVDQDGDGITVWLSQLEAGRLHEPARFDKRILLTLTPSDFDAIAAEVARFRRVQAMVDEAPADETAAMRRVS